MKKLFILTVLFSVANLGAAIPTEPTISHEEAHGHLTAAQDNFKKTMAANKHSEAGLHNLLAQHRKAPKADSYEQVKAAVERHNAQVERDCHACVAGIQRAAQHLNERGHYIAGSAFDGKVHHKAAPTA